MNNLNKALLLIIVVLTIALFITLGLYFNLKSNYDKLEADFLFSQDGERIEDTGNFLFSEEGK